MKKAKKPEPTKLNVNDTVLVDSCFTVDRTRWDTWKSYSPEGKELITSLTEDQCVQTTRWYLKRQQDEFTSQGTTYNGEVEGKL